MTSVREIPRRIERTEQWLAVPEAKVDAKAVNRELTSVTPLDYMRAMCDLMFLAFQTNTTRVSTGLLGTEGGRALSDTGTLKPALLG